MKITRSINVEFEIWEEAKSKTDNLSELINDFLKDFVKFDKDSNKVAKYKKMLKEIHINKSELEKQESMLKLKLDQIDKYNKDKKTYTEKIAQEKKITDKITQNARVKPLSIEEIQFFKDVAVGLDEPTQNKFYNSTFFTDYDMKQYLIRLNKYNYEVKEDAVN